MKANILIDYDLYEFCKLFEGQKVKYEYSFNDIRTTKISYFYISAKGNICFNVVNDIFGYRLDDIIEIGGY